MTQKPYPPVVLNLCVQLAKTKTKIPHLEEHISIEENITHTEHNLTIPHTHTQFTQHTHTHTHTTQPHTHAHGCRLPKKRAPNGLSIAAAIWAAIAAAAAAAFAVALIAGSSDRPTKNVRFGSMLLGVNSAHRTSALNDTLIFTISFFLDGGRTDRLL